MGDNVFEQQIGLLKYRTETFCFCGILINIGIIKDVFWLRIDCTVFFWLSTQ